jgi:hypothetical protein
MYVHYWNIMILNVTYCNKNVKLLYLDLKMSMTILLILGIVLCMALLEYYELNVT